jgi:hypothetical protein
MVNEVAQLGQAYRYLDYNYLSGKPKSEPVVPTPAAN